MKSRKCHRKMIQIFQIMFALHSWMFELATRGQLDPTPRKTPFQSPTIAESESIPKITILSNFPPTGERERLNCEIYDTPPILSVLCGFCTCLWFGTVGRDPTLIGPDIYARNVFMGPFTSERGHCACLQCHHPTHTYTQIWHRSRCGIYSLIESAKIDEIDRAWWIFDSSNTQSMYWNTKFNFCFLQFYVDTNLLFSSINTDVIVCLSSPK